MRVGVVVASALLIGACASIAGLDSVDPTDVEPGSGTSGGAGTSGNPNGTSGQPNGTSTSGSNGTGTSGQASSGQGTSSSSTSTGGVDSGQDTGPPPINEENIACTSDDNCRELPTNRKCAGDGKCHNRCTQIGGNPCIVFEPASCCIGSTCRVSDSFPFSKCEPN